MVLADSRVNELVDSGVLANASRDNIGPVSYDLTTDGFYTQAGKVSNISLMPGDSVFVATRESIHLPKNLVARVLIKNSRLRQGITLDAPLYFPGHETVVYFRVTNVSSDEISLSPARPIAQLTFEEVSGEVERPYQGTFSNEFEFKGLAGYKDIYAAETRRIEEK